MSGGVAFFFSLVPIRQQTVTYEKLAYQNIEGSVNSMQIYTFGGASLWITVILVLAVWGLVNLYFLKKKLHEAVLIERGKVSVYETDRLETPILLGFLRQAIYLPLHLSEEEKKYVLAHERVHVQRKDYLWKVFAYCILLLHWFNPLVWAGFYLFVKDMEMSCDERVLNRAGEDIRISYSETLLKLAMRQSRLPSVSPLAFGENNTKSRVKNVLRFRKTAVLTSVLCVLVIGVAAVVLLTERTDEGDGQFENEEIQQEKMEIQRAELEAQLEELEAQIEQRNQELEALEAELEKAIQNN